MVLIIEVVVRRVCVVRFRRNTAGPIEHLTGDRRIEHRIANSRRKVLTRVYQVDRNFTAPAVPVEILPADFVVLIRYK